MPLILTLNQTQDPGGQLQTRTLSEGSLTIGRAPGNDWVLADPQRHLSRTHCVIAAVDGGYVLTDLSVNGVFLNGASEPLSADRRTVLAAGDEIRLGDHVIAIAETTLPAAAPAAAAQPIDTLSDLFATGAGAGFAYPHAAAPAPRLDDPFDRADEMASREHAAAVEDLFKGFEPLEVWKGPSQPDNADAPALAIAEPRFVAEPRFDNLDIDALLGDEPPGQAAPVATPAHATPAHATPASAAPASTPPGPTASARSAPAWSAPAPTASARSAPVPAAPVPTRAPPGASPAAASLAAGDAGALLAAFLDGAGVTGLRLDAGTDPQAALRSAGEVFRVMVEGLREVLMSRAAVKQEFRAAQTMLGPCDNNPLKFSISAEDAVAALLRPGRRGYQPPLDAAREAFADLKSHELAVMAGAQTALMGLLRRIDPTVLEGQQQSGLLPVARKARCWELFRTTYKDMVRAAEDDFQSAFGRDFARAYEAQARQL